jgi:murein L,D-transpeptidase YafK
VSTVLDIEERAVQPLSAEIQAEMKRKGTSPNSPVLVRIFKEESELEVWKQTSSGRYALLKTYPMCRWSGKLGPKKRMGDRQAPEGFYHVSASMLNPQSQYYLSFNLGYPNKLERALGYTGEALMVHGACSSSGCFALTDKGVAEIYAIAREALRGGQRAFQVQAFPFRMTPRNMARNRNDPNFRFWMDLKRGHDSFEVLGREPTVAYCEGRYVFDTSDMDPSQDALASCPPDATEIPAVAVRSQADEVETERISATGTFATAHAYADGGMHPSFRRILERDGEKALSKRTSGSAVPISKPAAALADPHATEE